MRKFFALLIVCIMLLSCTGCEDDVNTSGTTKLDNDRELAESQYIPDYYDAQTFENDLNAGVEVCGKIVQFNVTEYKPNSALGVNCWSGEHLNFISESTLNVRKGEYVVGRITSEPTLVMLRSWKIPYEVLEIRTDKIEVYNCEVSGHLWNMATCVAPATCSICGDVNGAPLGHTWIEATCLTPKMCTTCYETQGDPKDHTVSEWKILRNPTCGAEGLKTGTCTFCAKTMEQMVPKTGKHSYEETIFSVATYYEHGEYGEKCTVCGDIQATSTYYSYCKIAPKAVFDAYRSNEISAEDKYFHMYVEFTASISQIEQGGLLSYGRVLFDVSSGGFYKDQIRCEMKTSGQLNYVKNLGAGDTVTIKGRLTYVLYDPNFTSYMYVDIQDITLGS